MKVLITSGGTKVPIDDVRYIGNMSTGRYGSELADKFNTPENDVMFFYEKGSKYPQSLEIDCYNGKIFSAIIPYKNYDEYLGVTDIAKNHQPDIIISAAAVSDFTTIKTEGKISSSDELVIKLIKAKKVLPTFKQVSPKSMVVGFKLLVSPKVEEIFEAVKKVFDNGADYVVFNDLSELRKGNPNRLFFSKDMSFVNIFTVEQLVNKIKDEYSIWSNR